MTATVGPTISQSAPNRIGSSTGAAEMNATYPAGGTPARRIPTRSGIAEYVQNGVTKPITIPLSAATTGRPPIQRRKSFRAESSLQDLDEKRHSHEEHDQLDEQHNR